MIFKQEGNYCHYCHDDTIYEFEIKLIYRCDDCGVEISCTKDETKQVEDFLLEMAYEIIGDAYQESPFLEKVKLFYKENKK